MASKGAALNELHKQLSKLSGSRERYLYSQISRVRPQVTSFPDLPGLSTRLIFPRSPGFVHQSHLSQIRRVRPQVTSFPDLPGLSPCHIFPRSPGFTTSHIFPRSPGFTTSHIFPRSPGFVHQSHLSQISRARPLVMSFL